MSATEQTTDSLSKTVLHEWHATNGAKMVPFAGWHMPVQYKTGIMKEHLAVRNAAGLFDVCHMGRFMFSGPDAGSFLQYATTNNIFALHEPGMAQYSLLQDEKGYAVDDIYVYRVGQDTFMMVVNASNRKKDWEHLSQFFSKFPRMAAEDRSTSMAMLALQGPNTQKILEDLMKSEGISGPLPLNEPNRVIWLDNLGTNYDLLVSRTGYTGEPRKFELFVGSHLAPYIWEQLLEVGRPHGLVPVGLGARDTLRLEAGYPLYGHELGIGPDGKEIPIFALYSLVTGRVSTRFDLGKGNFFARDALFRQYQEVSQLLRSGKTDVPLEERLVPRFVWPSAVLNDEGTGPGQKNVVRGKQHDGSFYEIYDKGRHIGWVTSGTSVPYWIFEREGVLSRPSDQHSTRSIALAYVDSSVIPGALMKAVEVIDPRTQKPIKAMLTRSNLRDFNPYAKPVLHPEKLLY